VIAEVKPLLSENLLALLMDLVTKIVSVAYPVLDVAVLAVAFGSYIALRVGTYWRPFRNLIVGIVLALAGHITSSFVRLLPIQPLATGSDVLLVGATFQPQSASFSG